MQGSGTPTSEGENSGHYRFEKQKNDLMDLIEGMTNNNRQTKSIMENENECDYSQIDDSDYLSEDGSYIRGSGSYISDESSYMKGSGGSETLQEQSSEIHFEESRPENDVSDERFVSDDSLYKSQSSFQEAGTDTSGNDSSYMKGSVGSEMLQDESSEMKMESETSDVKMQPLNDVNSDKNVSDDSMYKSMSSSNDTGNDTSDLSEVSENHDYSTLEISEPRLMTEESDRFKNLSESTLNAANSDSGTSGDDDASGYQSLTDRIFNNVMRRVESFENRSDTPQRRTSIGSRSSHGRLIRSRGEDYVDFFKCKSDAPSRPANPLTMKRRHSFHGRSIFSCDDSASLSSSHSGFKKKKKIGTKSTRRKSFNGMDQAGIPPYRPKSNQRPHAPNIPLSVPVGSTERGAKWETDPAEEAHNQKSSSNSLDKSQDKSSLLNSIGDTKNSNSKTIPLRSQIAEPQNVGNSIPISRAQIDENQARQITGSEKTLQSSNNYGISLSQPNPSVQDFLKAHGGDIEPTPLQQSASNSIIKPNTPPVSTVLSNQEEVGLRNKSVSSSNSASIEPSSNQLNQANASRSTSPVPLKRSNSLQNQPDPPLRTSPDPMPRSNSVQNQPAPPSCTSPTPIKRNTSLQQSGLPPSSPVPMQRCTSPSKQNVRGKVRRGSVNSNRSVATMNSSDASLSHYSVTSKHTIDTSDEKLPASYSQNKRWSMDDSHRSRDFSAGGLNESSMHGSMHSSRHSSRSHSRRSRRLSQEIADGLRYNPESSFEKSVQSLLAGNKVPSLDVLQTNDNERLAKNKTGDLVSPQVENFSQKFVKVSSTRSSLEASNHTESDIPGEGQNFFEEISTDEDEMEFKKLSELQASEIENCKELKDQPHRRSSDLKPRTSALSKLRSLRSFFSDKPSFISLSWRHNDIEMLGMEENNKRSVFASLKGDSDNSSSLGDEIEWNDEGYTGVDRVNERMGIMDGKVASKLRAKTWIWGDKIQRTCPGLWEWRKALLIGVLALVTILCVAIPLSNSPNDKSNSAALNGNAPSISPSTAYPTSPDIPFFEVGGYLTGSQGDETGKSISMSADGRYLAIGYVQTLTGPGKVQVFRWFNGRFEEYGTPILGGKKGDKFGYSISLSENGQEIAIGAPNADNNYGYAVVYKFNFQDSVWRQMGDKLKYYFYNGHAGSAVALSGNSQRLAVGIPRANNYDGATLIYEKNEKKNGWRRVTTIHGEQGELMGSALAFSRSGNTVAISAVLSPTPEGPRGRVYVLRYTTSWKQIGNPLSGADLFGRSVSLSADGNSLAIGSTGFDKDSLKDTGACEVYEYFLNGWERLGSKIEGEVNKERSGYSVVLSGDGARLSCGGPGNSVVRVYSKFGSSWQLNEKILGGSGAGFGSALAMNYYGTRLVVGAPSDRNQGIVSIYDPVDGFELQAVPSSMPTSKPPTLTPSQSPTPLENIAFNKTSSQSSTAHGGIASKGNDGNTEGFWSQGSVIHTARGPAWWKVNLGSVASIKRVILYNRLDLCCKSSLDNATVAILDQNEDIVTSKLLNEDSPDTVELDFDEVKGTFVRVSVDSDVTLMLAEVEVYGFF